MFPMFDPLYWIIMLPVMLIAGIAQMKVKSSFAKYSKYRTANGLTGAQVADEILRRNDINDVKIEPVSGMLSDHYSPTEKVLRLSQEVYASNSISAVGVAAHEAGHTLQHVTGMGLMRFWMSLARPAAFASNGAIFLIIIGMFIAPPLAKLGIILFAGAVIFQIITIPLELDASNRAKRLLYEYNIVNSNERAGVATVLNAAALTYVAAAIAALAQLLYWAIRLGLIGGDD